MPDSIDLSDKLVVRNSVRMRQESFGRLVIPEIGGTLCLNESASAVLDLCDGARSIQEVLDALSKNVNLDAALKEKILKLLFLLVNRYVLAIKSE